MVISSSLLKQSYLCALCAGEKMNVLALELCRLGPRVQKLENAAYLHATGISVNFILVISD